MLPGYMLTPRLIYPAGKGLQTNLDSCLAAPETSQEIMSAQCDTMSIVLRALQNSTLSTIHLPGLNTIRNECEFLRTVIQSLLKVSDHFRCTGYRGVQVNQRETSTHRGPR